MSRYLDGRPVPPPSRLRFLAFGLAVVVGRRGPVDAPVRDPGRRLDAVHRAGAAPRAPCSSRCHRRAASSTTGSGTPLVSNTASYSVEDSALGPARIAPRRGRADPRRAHRHPTRSTSTSRSTRTPARATTSSASPRTSSRRSRRSLRSRERSCRAFEVVVETRRNYEQGRVVCPHPWLHRPDQRRRAPEAEAGGLPAGRPAWPRRRRDDLRGRAARRVRAPDGRAGRSRPRDPGAPHRPGAGCRQLFTPDARRPRAGARREGDALGHEGGRPEARRRDRDEPAERRDPGHGQPAEL